MAKEYAPGIPSKEVSHELPEVKKPETWEFAIHEHHAQKRGLHYDLRLGDPDTGHAHSWALPPKMPEPGTSVEVAQQPTHTVEYMDFKGTIPEGYGAGKVNLKERSKAEVTNAAPGHISFNLYKSSGPEEYTLHRLGGKIWKLFNRTPSKKEHTLPHYKPTYKEQPIDKINVEDQGHVLSAKIDDAHNVFVFPQPGKKVRVFSYRPGKRTKTGLIEHTHKVPGIEGTMRSDKDLSNTIVRGGLYAMDPKTGKATAPEIIGGMLNSDVWKSREKQKEHGKLKAALYDVVQYKGKNMENAPYKDKLEVLNKIVSKFPKVFHLPTMAFSAEDKKKLIEKITNKKLPETEEGVISWNLHEEGKPAIKSKLRREHDVFIRGFYEGAGKYEGKGVGGFSYSHTPTGPIVGSVGSGLSDAQRKDMYQHPEKYRGLVAKIDAMRKMKSGALFQPTFEGFHLDKNEQRDLDRIKLASFFEGFEKQGKDICTPAKEMVEEHKHLVHVLKTGKGTKAKAKKQGKELKEYEEKLGSFVKGFIAKRKNHPMFDGYDLGPVEGVIQPPKLQMFG